MSERTFTKDELLELARTWRKEADTARVKSDAVSRLESSIFHAGKCVALLNCAEHLEWYLGAAEPVGVCDGEHPGPCPAWHDSVDGLRKRAEAAEAKLDMVRAWYDDHCDERWASDAKLKAILDEAP